ncbi:MAG: polyphenol oxidase family protein [Planctomycetota bacterium]
MHFVQIAPRRYAQFDRLRQVAGLVHAFSTRPENLAPRNGDHADERRQMVADWGLNPQRLCHCEQVHGRQITVVEDPWTGGPLAETDGAITALPELPLMAFSADCPLVLVADPVRRVLGLVHASWRCTVARMTARLVEQMTTRFDCRSDDLWAGVGPGAGPCCYEVGPEVYEAAAGLTDRDRCFVERDGRRFFDLWTANRVQLLETGVPADRVEIAELCTMCRTDVFFSYRREGPGCGHFALLAALTAR